MTPILDSDERAMLDLIAIQHVVPVPLFKPVTDGLQAKRLVVLDQCGAFRITKLGATVIGQTRRLH